MRENLSLLGRPHPIHTHTIHIFILSSIHICISLISFDKSPCIVYYPSLLASFHPGTWWLRIPVMSLFLIFIFLFYLPFFFFFRGYYIFLYLAMEWQLRPTNGSHIYCRLHRFVVCLTISLFSFFDRLSSFLFLLFLFVAFRTCVLNSQTNK